MRIIREIDKERVGEILDRIENKKGILIGLDGNKAIILKDDGKYNFEMNEGNLDIKLELDNCMAFDFESEFWYWMKNWYDSGEFDNEEYKDEIIGIDKVVRKIEDNKGKGILISIDKNNKVKIIKNMEEGIYRKMAIWFDSGKDEIIGEKDIKEIINELIDKGEQIYYFKDYKDFIKWIVIGWNYLK